MRNQIPWGEQMKHAERGADLDTVTYGTEGPFEPWESDNTALVHILWDAHHKGLDLHKDASQIASMIQNSRWHAATTAR